MNTGLAEVFRSGLTGFWNDEADEGFPSAQFHFLQKALYEGQRGESGTREIPLGFKVLNIDQVANAVVASGGFIHSPKRQAPGEPAIIKAGDTEGNVFFLSEGPGA